MDFSRKPRTVGVIGIAGLLSVTAACTRRESRSDPVPSPPVAETSAATTDAITAATAPVATAPTAAEPTQTDPPEVSAPQGLPSGEHRFLLEHDGRDRSYRVYVPEAVAASPAVMVALHGGGGTGEQFQSENEMDVVADREGFIVLYPEGSGVLRDRLHTWNSGFNCCGYAFDREVDDVGFLRAVIDDIDTRTPIDRGRVYMTGHSNGAMMSYRFAVEAADYVTAIVPVAGALSVREPNPSQPVPLLHIHSADDPRAMYDGGEGPPFPGTNRTHVAEPVLPGIEAWASLNGCDATASLADSIDGPGDERLDRFSWTCPDGAAVEHLQLFGSGHGWPGVRVDPIIQRFLGPPTTIIDASEEIWAFASQFDRTP